MKTLDDLTPEQRTFIKRYLKGGITYIFRQEEKQRLNAAIIDAFGNYEELRAMFVASAERVPEDYRQRGPVMQLLVTADQQRGGGEFQQAAGTIRPAITQMENLYDLLKRKADELRAKAPALGDVAIALSDRNAIEAARHAFLAHLADDLPTFAEMQHAEDALIPYKRAVRSAEEAAAKLPKAQLNFDSIKTNARFTLYTTAAILPEYYATTPQGAELATAVQAAEDLLREIQNVDRNDPAMLNALAAKLDAFVAEGAEDRLLPAAWKALVAESDKLYAADSTDIRAAMKIDLSRFSGDPDHAAMLRLQESLALDVKRIRAPIVAYDPMLLDERNKSIRAAADRAKKLAERHEAAKIRSLKARLTKDGASPAHQDGILKLGKRNRNAGNEVLRVVSGTADWLGGASATSDFSRTQLDMCDKIQGQIDKIKQEIETEKQDRDLHKKELDRLEANRDRLGGLVISKQASDDQQAELKKAAREASKARTTYETAEQRLQAKEAELRTKKDELEQAGYVFWAAERQRQLLDAVTFGPLSPDAPHPIPDALVEDIVKLFGKNSLVADQACSLLSMAKDPASLIETAGFLADQWRNGFEWSPPAEGDNDQPPAMRLDHQASEAYTWMILKRAACFGPKFANDAQAAIKRGVHHETNKDIDPAKVTRKEAARIRGTQAAFAMMETRADASGNQAVKLDLNSNEFNRVLDAQKFSTSGQVQASSMLNAEMDKLKAFFDDPTEGAARVAEAENILNAIKTVPASPAARSLLTKSMGIPAADFDDPAKADEVKRKVQAAILKAMVTPVAQGEVGSCFATAPLRNLRDKDPLAVMRMYAEIATTGMFTPAQGPVVPAVTNVQDTDDPLTRSLEYSVATASGRLAHSKERKELRQALFSKDGGAFKGLRRPLGQKKFKKLHDGLIRAISQGSAVVYNPMAVSTQSSDGKSTSGSMQLVDIRNNSPILSEEDFRAFVKRKANEVITAAGLKKGDRAAVEKYLDSPDFIEGVVLRGNAKPWAMRSGGWTDQASEAVLGTGGTGTVTETELLSIDPADSIGERAKKILKALGGLTGRNMTVITTQGMHGFNALPPTGDYKALVTGDVDANIQKMLVEPGQKIATEKMPKDKAIYLYEKHVENVIRRMRAQIAPAELTAVRGNRPTSDMTPAELEEHSFTALDAIRTAEADYAADQWAASEVPPPSAAALAKRRTDEKKDHDKGHRTALTGFLAGDLGAPQFVIADSNWGDESNHKLFVIAPDPLTGEPKLWEKDAIGGDVLPMKDEWLEKKWSAVQ